MTLTAWNNASGGSDFSTREFIAASCNDPTIVPKKSYWVIGSQMKVDSSVQVDPTSDDRFRPVLRAHISTPEETAIVGGCKKFVFHSDDLASVWNVNLMAVAPAPAVAGGAVALVVPQIQFRFIQSINGNQTKRATVLYKPTTAAGSLGYLIQLHGVESNELEVWAWIDPEINGTVSATMSLLIGVKMDPSSGNNVILGNDCSVIP